MLVCILLYLGYITNFLTLSPYQLRHKKQGSNMKFNFLSTAAFALGMSLSGFASAEVITVSESFDITESGQDFTFSFDAISEDIIGDVTFFVNASGDFDLADETLTIDFAQDFDDLVLNANGVSSQSSDLTQTSFESEALIVTRDFTFSAEFTVSELLSDFLSSNDSVIFASTSNTVRNFFAINRAGQSADFVEVGFTFDVAEVSEPTTLAIFGLGLMGLAARRFKKNA